MSYREQWTKHGSKKQVIPRIIYNYKVISLNIKFKPKKLRTNYLYLKDN